MLIIEKSCIKLLIYCISAFKNHERLHSFNQVTDRWPEKEVVDFTLFSPHLVKLTLNDFRFEQDPMSQLEKLPKLRVLELFNAIIEADGKQMICSRGGFSRLQRLLLSVDNLKEWKIEGGAVCPCSSLNQLVLKCFLLQIVPDLQYWPTFKSSVLMIIWIR
ncbi:disease resistance protein RDL6 [Carex littledalei]|uniref:Disease resistance protein RDL6 n=1 Tax=Carex littledalei TaxID=544730 RepID=A0A833RL21_9POAL|nr:disease resistance protein RDL6 [Carex littledalei]